MDLLYQSLFLLDPMWYALLSCCILLYCLVFSSHTSAMSFSPWGHFVGSYATRLCAYLQLSERCSLAICRLYLTTSGLHRGPHAGSHTSIPHPRLPVQPTICGPNVVALAIQRCARVRAMWHVRDQSSAFKDTGSLKRPPPTTHSFPVFTHTIRSSTPRLHVVFTYL